MNAASKEYDGKNKYIRITDINDETREFSKENLTSPDIDLKNLDSYKLKKGDIVFARTGASVGKTYLYNEKDEVVYYAGFLIRAQIKNQYSNEFIFQNTLTKKYIDFIYIMSQRSGQPGINSKEYASFELKVPNSEEQNKIGSFLNNIDNLISLHQRKLEKLGNIKKSMLEKMFPKDENKVPEIRFKGFNDDWEQHKVYEIFKITRGYVLPSNMTEKKQTKENFYPVYSSQTKDNGLMGYYKDYLYENAITWTTDGANAGTVNYREGKFYCTNVCGVLLSNKIKTNKMIAEALNNVSKGYVSYVGNPKLMNNVMADIEIKIPSSEIEREEISKLFINIDNLISLHQRKLEKLKNIKKACLEKMFV